MIVKEYISEEVRPLKMRRLVDLVDSDDPNNNNDAVQAQAITMGDRSNELNVCTDCDKRSFKRLDRKPSISFTGENDTNNVHKQVNDMSYDTSDGDKQVNDISTTVSPFPTSKEPLIASSDDCDDYDDVSSQSSSSSGYSTDAPSTHLESKDEDEEERVKELMNTLEPNLCSSDMSPDLYLQKLFATLLKFDPVVKPTLELSSPPQEDQLLRETCEGNDHNANGTSGKSLFIPPITEEELLNYGVDVVTATRENDLETLRSIHSSGRSLSCCNRFGESLLHMACRRGYASIVLFLVEEANVSVRITDDCGRTPLHDALWHKECQYVIMDLLVRTEPWLLLTCDKRGHTPFAYTRREHWANWRQFLWDRREHMLQAMDVDGMQLFKSLSS